jgi:putative heme-binding domain-containing protein
MQSLDRIGWGDHREAILAAVTDETDRLVRYTTWQVMRRQLPEKERRALLEDERFGMRYLAALGLMQDDDRNLQRRADDFLKDTGKPSAKKAEQPVATVLIEATEQKFRESTSVAFKAVPSGYVEPVKKPIDPSGSPLRIDLGPGGKAEPQPGWAEWEIDANGPVDEARSFPFVDAAGGSVGSSLIRTHQADHQASAADILTFKVNLATTVMVAYDNTRPVPAWLKNAWTKTRHEVRTSGGATFPVYQKDVEPGTVTLGGNGGAAAMYHVYLRKSGAQKTTTKAVQTLLAKANQKRGEEIFFGRGTCFACHQVKGRGVVIGPELVGIHKRRDAAYVIESILEPDAYIVEGFQQTSLEMKDGRKLFGMINEETAQAIKIALPTGEVVEGLAENVQTRDDAGHSGMPSSFVHTLSPQDVADLTAWIMELK